MDLVNIKHHLRTMVIFLFVFSFIFPCGPLDIVPTLTAMSKTVDMVLISVTSSPSRMAPPSSPVPRYRCRVVAAYPHDRNSFTQGLFFHDGFLYEGTGLHGQSAINKVDLTTGHLLKSKSLPAQYFGEGITLLKKKIFQLTWLSKQGFIYDLDSFTLEKKFSYHTIGWGLTNDGTSLIMSDGSFRLYYLNPLTFARERTIEVKEGPRHITNLNELEYIDGEIFANIWQSDRIVRVSPINGAVAGWIDCQDLLSKEERSQSDVLNGIAWDNVGKRLFLTGKRWPKLFHVDLVPE